jgi:hypothetical protein
VVDVRDDRKISCPLHQMRSACRRTFRRAMAPPGTGKN